MGGVGGGILGNIPGGLPGPTVPITTVSFPRIIYGSHLIDFPKNVAWDWKVEPNPLHTFDMAEDGNARTTLYARMDILVRGLFRVIDNNPNLRVDLMNWWQWALHGYGWYITLDASRSVDTTLTGNSSGTTLTVTDATGIIIGQIYKLIYGYGYALVEVANVSGNTITLTRSLDVTFPAGTKFRDQNFYRGVIANRNASNPIVDLEAPDQQFPQGWFSVELEFEEDAIS
jgi:hypothetical protein